MSDSSTGGFDLVMEISNTFLLECLYLPPLPVSQAQVNFGQVGSGQVTGELTIQAEITGLAFQPSQIPGNSINADVTISLNGSSMSINAPYFPHHGPVPVNSININGDVTVTIELNSNVKGGPGAALLADFSNPAIDVGVSVLRSILSAPIVKFLLSQLILMDPSGASGIAFEKTIETAMNQQVESYIPSCFSSVSSSTILDFSQFSRQLRKLTLDQKGISNFLLGSGPVSQGQGPDKDSLFLLLTIGGTTGVLPTNSNLKRVGSPDVADLIISNSCFLRDFMGEFAIRNQLIDSSPFSPASPFDWSGNSPLTSITLGGITAATTGAIAGINGGLIQFQLQVTGTGPDALFSINISIDILISLNVSIANSMLLLDLELVGNPLVNIGNPVFSAAGWVVLSLGGGMSDLLTGALSLFGGGIANNIFASNIASNISSTLENDISSSPLTLQLPGGLPAGLSVRQPINLSQFPITPPFTLPFPPNDIIINFI